MQDCEHCQVQVRGNKKECPLCKNPLPKDQDNSPGVFPEIPPSYARHLAIRIMLFISIVTIIVSFAADLLIPSNINRPLLILFGLLSMWVSVIVVIQKRHNTSKTILWQVAIVSILSVLWDWRIGWRGWSLEYVIPITCVAAMFVMYVTAKIMKLSIRDYIIYFLLDGLFGIIPILFILFGWVEVIYPSVLCIGVSIIFISAIFIFQGEDIKMELNKKMHL